MAPDPCERHSVKLRTKALWVERRAGADARRETPVALPLASPAPEMRRRRIRRVRYGRDASCLSAASYRAVGQLQAHEREGSAAGDAKLGETRGRGGLRVGGGRRVGGAEVGGGGWGQRLAERRQGGGRALLERAAFFCGRLRVRKVYATLVRLGSTLRAGGGAREGAGGRAGQ